MRRPSLTTRRELPTCFRALTLNHERVRFGRSVHQKQVDAHFVPRMDVFRVDWVCIRDLRVSDIQTLSPLMVRVVFNGKR